MSDELLETDQDPKFELSPERRAGFKEQKKDQLIDYIENLIGDLKEVTHIRDRAMRELQTASEERNLLESKVDDFKDIAEQAVTQTETVGRYAGQVIHWDPENNRSWEQHESNLEDFQEWQFAIRRTLEAVGMARQHVDHVHLTPTPGPFQR